MKVLFLNEAAFCETPSGIKSDTILYYTILYYTILYYTILYYTILYYIILYYTSCGQHPACTTVTARSSSAWLETGASTKMTGRFVDVPFDVVDDINLASPNVYYTAVIPMGLVYKVM